MSGIAKVFAGEIVEEGECLRQQIVSSIMQLLSIFLEA